MLPLQGLAVHLVGQQDLVSGGIRDGQAALVKLDFLALNSLIEAGE